MLPEILGGAPSLVVHHLYVIDSMARSRSGHGRGSSSDARSQSGQIPHDARGRIRTRPRRLRSGHADYDPASKPNVRGPRLSQGRPAGGPDDRAITRRFMGKSATSAD